MSASLIDLAVDTHDYIEEGRLENENKNRKTFLSHSNLFHRIVKKSKKLFDTAIDDDNQELTEQEQEVVNFHRIAKIYSKPENIMSVQETPFSNRYVVVLVILSFSILGNMARISFQKLITYQNAYVYYHNGTIIWINFTSCLILGWANNCNSFWECLTKGSKVNTKYNQIALHSGITAGFCGCFSTLSALMIELFFKTTNNTTRQVPNHGYGVMEFFAIVLGQFGLCFLGLELGSDFGFFFDSKITPLLKPYLDIKVLRFIEWFFVICGILAYIANLILTCVLPLENWYKNQYSLSILFGGVAAYLRFRLSSLNGKIFAAWFPTGTLLANIGGCTILAVIQVLTHGYKYKGGQEVIVSTPLHLFIINAFSMGFGGSLSTIAAMCNEIKNLNYPRYRYSYFFATFLTCWCIVILIDGSYSWSVGFSPI
ncbi:hypothetical protein DAMA08_030120 [Martiniozyma asiatica (nom. inval.)]|nr:hypothetical protein DAMA08_030120 [Martiniozyma asiatica]